MKYNDNSTSKSCAGRASKTQKRMYFVSNSEMTNQKRIYCVSNSKMTSKNICMRCWYRSAFTTARILNSYH